MPTRGARGLVVAALVVTGLACGPDEPGEAGTPTTQESVADGPSAGTEVFETVDTIVIKSFEFTPDRPAATVGDTLTVRNEDAATHSITATDDKALFDSGQFAAGERRITLTAAGTFDFVCSVHSFMRGVIQVSA